MSNEIVDGLYGTFEIFGHDEGIRLALKQFGAYQASNLRMFLDTLSAGDYVLDLGAHVGTFCVAIARRIGRTGKVVAVEGTPATHELLQRNLDRNGVTWAAALNRVVSDRDATYAVNFGGRGHMHNTGAARHHVSEDGVRSIAIAALVKEELGGRLDAMKVDIEGMDLEVLTSGRAELRHHMPIVCFETTINLARAAKYDELFGEDYVFFANLEFRRSTTQTFIPHRLDRLGNTYSAGQHDLFAIPRIHPVAKRWSEYLSDAAEREFREALFLRRLGRVEAADATLRAMPQQDVSEHLLARADVASRDGRHGEALALSNRAIQLAPDDVESYLTAAVMARRARELGHWLNYATEAALRGPNNAAAISAKASALCRFDRHEEARQLLDDFGQRFGNHPGVLVVHSTICWTLGDREAAIAKARAACSIKRTHIGGRFQLAKCLVQSGDISGAQREIADLEHLLPRHKRVTDMKARIQGMADKMLAREMRLAQRGAQPTG